MSERMKTWFVIVICLLLGHGLGMMTAALLMTPGDKVADLLGIGAISCVVSLLMQSIHYHYVVESRRNGKSPRG
jgi:hypothetical protein